MKGVFIVIVGLAMAFSAAADQQGRAEHTISVSGHAEIRIVPDEVQVSLGVESFAIGLNDAKADNDQKVSAVISAARGHGIPTEHVTTDYLGIEPRYEDSYEHERFLGFVVRRSIVIILRDLSAFERLLGDALTAGANHVHGIEFRTTELRRHRDRARALALVAAREKASAMAAEYGRLVGEALTISEGYSGLWSPYGSWWGGRWSGTAAQNVVQSIGGTHQQLDSTMAPGQISVSASVSVTFELLGGDK